jgi:hypothetical protein
MSELNSNTTPAGVTHYIGADNSVILDCLNCDHRLTITDVITKFVEYRRVTCRRCGTHYAVDLYFENEHDCACLILYGG